MTSIAFRYQFTTAVPADEIEATLLLAVVAAESLHGETLVRLDGVFSFDPTARTCGIETDTPVGRDLNRLFAGFAAREFGPAAFRVDRVPAAHPTRTGRPGPAKEFFDDTAAPVTAPR